MEAFRASRLRCKRYVFGDQWGDAITVGDRMVTEREFIMSQGQVPLKNNLLRRILRNVIGIYRSNYLVTEADKEDDGESGATAAKLARSRIFRINRMEDLVPRMLEEFLISGLSAVRIEAGSDGDPRILPVTSDNFFFHSDGYDPRGWDVDMVGEVHEIGYGTLLSRFCRNAGDFERLESIFGDKGRAGEPCRLVEVWHKDTSVFGAIHDKKRGVLRLRRMEDLGGSLYGGGENGIHHGKEDVRSIVRSGWRCCWYASDGTLLSSSPMAGGHPYVFRAYPFIDGEVHGYVGDIIDQQRYVNRLITLYDFIMKSSAKGVLLFPDESIPRDMTLQDVADEWSRFNGVIPFRAQPGVPLPTQVSGNAANIGITELLKIEMQMLEDISGISPTLQGRLETTSTSGTLFAHQNAAAQTSLLDLLRTFDSHVKEIGDCVTHKVKFRQLQQEKIIYSDNC